MISNKKISKQSKVSIRNISTVLPKYILGYILEYSELNSLSTLGTFNKNFKKIIWDEKLLPLFNFFLDERRNTRCITYFEPVFCGKNPKNCYIHSFKDKLQHGNKFKSSQKTDLEGEIINSLLERLCREGVLVLGSKVEEIENPNNVENIRNLCNFLKVSQTLVNLKISWNSLGREANNIINLSFALKANKSLFRLDLAGNWLRGNSQHIKTSVMP